MAIKKTATRVAAKTLGIIGGAMGAAAPIGAVSGGIIAGRNEKNKHEARFQHLGYPETFVDTDPAATHDAMVNGALTGTATGAAIGALAAGIPLAVKGIRGYRASRRAHLADGAKEARK